MIVPGPGHCQAVELPGRAFRLTGTLPAGKECDGGRKSRLSRPAGTPGAECPSCGWRRRAVVDAAALPGGISGGSGRGRP